MSGTLRIARVLSRLNLGGPARQVLASDPRLVERGHELHVFAGHPEPGEGDLFDALRERGVRVERVPGLARGLSLRGALAQIDPDVVHTHASKAGALGRRAARGLRAARVHTFHGHVLEGYFSQAVSRGLVRVERRLARDTDRVVAVSHATADDLVRLGIVDESKLTVVPPGIEVDDLLAIELAAPARRDGRLRRRLGVGDEARLVGVVGRLAEVKRPQWALEVLALLAERRPELQIVFVGDGDQRGMLERKIAALPAPLGARAHMIGGVTDMTPVWRDLDCALLCSRTEGLPVALIEAAAAGLPVVATRVGGVAEVVAEERSGFLGETVDELAFGLDQVFSTPDQGAALGQRGRTRVATRHGAAGLADNLEQLYHAVHEERRCAS
jgi:glycosyltransferase involved in cell wall biosynthesis